jgi:pyochelin synthetase
MDHDLPIYGIQSRALSDHLAEHSSISEMAEDYANLILLKQPAGFHHLLGHSLGGALALATAAALEKKGQVVNFVGLLDPFLPGDKEELVNLAAIESIISYLQSLVPRMFDSSMEDRVRTPDNHVRVLQETLQVLPPEEKLPKLMEYVSENQEILAGTPVELVQQHLNLVQLHLSLGGTFFSTVIHAPLYLWRARERTFLEGAGDSIDWSKCTTGGVSVEEVDGDHFSMLQPPYVDKTAACVSHVLRAIHGLN